MTKQNARAEAAALIAEALAKGLSVTKVEPKKRMRDISRQAFIRRAAEFREVTFGKEG